MSTSKRNSYIIAIVATLFALIVLISPTLFMEENNDKTKAKEIARVQKKAEKEAREKAFKKVQNDPIVIKHISEEYDDIVYIKATINEDYIGKERLSTGKIIELAFRKLEKDYKILDFYQIINHTDLMGENRTMSHTECIIFKVTRKRKKEK